MTDDDKRWTSRHLSEAHAFIQWKGTDVCLDFHCECGNHCHFDGDFCYSLKCPYCGAIWEMPSNIFPRKVSAAPGCIVHPEKDEEE